MQESSVLLQKNLPAIYCSVTGHLTNKNFIETDVIIFMNRGQGEKSERSAKVNETVDNKLKYDSACVGIQLSWQRGPP